MKNYKRKVLALVLISISVLAFIYGGDFAASHPFYGGFEGGVDTGKGGGIINAVPLVISVTCLSVWAVVCGMDKEERK